MKSREVLLNKRYKHFKGQQYRTFYEYNSELIIGDIDFSKLRKFESSILREDNKKEVLLYVPKWELNDDTLPLVVLDKETNELIKGKWIIYQGLYEPFQFWMREKHIFLSEVDKAKYPNAIQKYKFELDE